MLYGHGPAVYIPKIVNGKLTKEWVDCPKITDWLNSWKQRGIECDHKEFAKAIIKNYYYFYDFFVKIRFTVGKGRGACLLYTSGYRFGLVRTDQLDMVAIAKDNRMFGV